MHQRTRENEESRDRVVRSIAESEKEAGDSKGPTVRVVLVLQGSVALPARVEEPGIKVESKNTDQGDGENR